MNRTDKLFRARVIEWLAKEKHTEAELADGAMMVLQCNRNRALYNTIMRRPARFEDKIAYELRKHLRYMNDGLSLDDVKDLEKKVMPVVEQVLHVEVTDDKPLPSPAYDADNGQPTNNVVARGKRADHESLPPSIKAIWDRNAERYKKIKQAHETCKTLTAACDRYEYTKAIAEAWADYKKDFDTYDHYVLQPDSEETTDTSAGEQLSADELKAISLARPYISKNLPDLLELKKATTDDETQEKYAEKLAKVQERVDVLIRTKQVITDELKAQLIEAGITFEKTDSDEQGQEHSDDTPAVE